MRFLLDENTPREFAVALRSEGHDVLWIPETNFRSLDDQRVRSLGRDQDRVLITYDLEFPTQGPYPPGIILVRKIDRLSASALAAMVTEAVREKAPHLAGHVVVVAAGQTRRRPL